MDQRPLVIQPGQPALWFVRQGDSATPTAIELTGASIRLDEPSARDRAFITALLRLALARYEDDACDEAYCDACVAGTCVMPHETRPRTWGSPNTG